MIPVQTEVLVDRWMSSDPGAEQKVRHAHNLVSRFLRTTVQICPAVSTYAEQAAALLTGQVQTHPDLCTHGVRVAGYARAITATVGETYNDPEHIALASIAGAVHDDGKRQIDPEVLYRSLGVPGFGNFDRRRDMPGMYPHPKLGYDSIGKPDVDLPLDAQVAAGGHHQIAGPGQRPYGIPYEQIHAEHSPDHVEAAWLGFLVGVTNMADFYDAATSRPADNHFGNYPARIQSIVERATLIFGERASEVVTALDQHRIDTTVAVA